MGVSVSVSVEVTDVGDDVVSSSGSVDVPSLVEVGEDVVGEVVVVSSVSVSVSVSVVGVGVVVGVVVGVCEVVSRVVGVVVSSSVVVSGGGGGGVCVGVDVGPVVEFVVGSAGTAVSSSSLPRPVVPCC